MMKYEGDSDSVLGLVTLSLFLVLGSHTNSHPPLTSLLAAFRALSRA